MDAAAKGASPKAGAIKDSLGCSLTELSKDQALDAGHMVFRRKAASGRHRAQVATPAQDRGVLIGISLADGHRRSLREGRAAHDCLFDHGDIYLRDFEENYKAEMDGSFDFFLIELMPEFWRDAEKVAGVSPDVGLARQLTKRDMTLYHLANAVLPLLEDPELLDPILVEQMATTIGAHLLKRHGDRRSEATGFDRGLGSVMVRKAKEMLVSTDEEDGTSIATIAEALNMSRSHFFRAFRESTGISPYQWLLKQRIDNAQRLLRTTNLPLSEIALHCGFSDQSHFTRIFSRDVGVTPKVWRQRVR